MPAARAQVGGGFAGLGAAHGFELYTPPADAEHLCRPCRELFQRVAHPLRLEQRRRDLRQEGRFALALLRVRGPATRPRRELADDDGGDEIDGQRNPVLRVPERECVVRRQEEEVEGEHRRDGDEHRVRRAEDEGHRQHGEQVEDAQAESRGEAPQPEDRAGDDGDERRATQESGDVQTKPTPRHELRIVARLVALGFLARVRPSRSDPLFGRRQEPRS